MPATIGPCCFPSSPGDWRIPRSGFIARFVHRITPRAGKMLRRSCNPTFCSGSMPWSTVMRAASPRPAQTICGTWRTSNGSGKSEQAVWLRIRQAAASYLSSIGIALACSSNAVASFLDTEGKSSSKRGSALRAPRRSCLRASMQIYRHAGMLAGICGRRYFWPRLADPRRCRWGLLRPARAFKRSGRKAGQGRGWDWPLRGPSGGSRPFRAWRRAGFGGLGRN